MLILIIIYFSTLNGKLGNGKILHANLAILIYVFIRFSFGFALAAVMALFHDFIITTTLVTYLNIEISLATIAALLTVIGYSPHIIYSKQN